MKTKKKLLLMGVGAMSALAIGVGATSTFAWYQATSNAGKAIKVSDDGDIGIANPNYTADAIDMPVKVSVDRVVSAKNYKDTDGVDGISGADTLLSLELAHWYGNTPTHLKSGSSDGEGLYAGYRDLSGSVITNNKAAKDDEHALFATYMAEVTIDKDYTGDAGAWNDGKTKFTAANGAVFTVAQLEAQLATEKIRVSLTADSIVVVATNDTTVTEGKQYYTSAGATATPSTDNPKTEGLFEESVPASRAKFFGIGTSEPASASSGSAPLVTTSSNDLTMTGFGTNSYYRFYFGLYVEGDGYSDGASDTPNGNFKLQIGDPSKFA